jgi:hypothetical protein
MVKRFLPTLFLLLASLPVAAQVRVEWVQPKDPQASRIAIQIDGKPFTAFFIGSDTSKPYLHPLRSASGKIVTRSYPMELVEGESRDHPHHRGLWFTHGDVNGLDFWSNEPAQGGNKGKVVLKKVLALKSGKKSGTVEATFDWNDPSGKALLTETRKMVFYSDPKLRTIDIDITLQPLKKVTFGDTKEGTFAIRLATELEEPVKPNQKPVRTGKMVSAEGRETEKNVWGTRSPWVDYFGELQGEKLGIVIMDHPENPRHPTYWHSRSYGLFAANIFGLRDFLRDKSQDGSLTIQPGNPVRFRYRVVIHPGDYRSANVADMYKNWTAGK